MSLHDLKWFSVEKKVARRAFDVARTRLGPGSSLNSRRGRPRCSYLAELVATHRLSEDEAHEISHDLAYRLAKEACRL